jgi:hypothetical protein
MMARDKDNPPFPTPAELKAMAAAFKERERADKKRPGPENPVIVALNTSAKAFWDEKSEAASALISKHPEDVKFAIDLFKKPWSLEDQLLGLAERDRRQQQRRAKLARKRKADVLDGLIREGIRLGMKSPDMWRWIVGKAQSIDCLATDGDVTDVTTVKLCAL